MLFGQYTIDVYVKHLDSQKKALRRGQYAFNLLHELKPDLAYKISGTEIDPFYEDSRLLVFLEYVAVHWDETLDKEE